MRSLSLALGAALFLFLSIVTVQTQDSYAAGANLKAVGKVTSVSGKTDIIKPLGKDAARPLRKGMLVYEKDMIRTASGAKAEVTFNDGSVINVAPDSKIEVSQYVFGADNTTRKKGVVKVYRGKMRSVVSKAKGLLSLTKLSLSDSTFETRTPVAIAGVKGTDYVTSYGLNGAAFFVNDGTVAVTNPNFPDKVVILGAGKVTFVVSDKKPPTKPRDANDTENASFNKGTEGGDDDGGDDQGGGDEGGGDDGGGDDDGFSEGDGGGDNSFSDGEGGGDQGGEGGGDQGGGDNFTDSLTNGNFLPFDDIPPVITYTGLPQVFTNQNTATVTIDISEQSTVTYTFDGGVTNTLGSGTNFTIPLAGLTEAVHTLTVTAVDTANNTTISSYSWVNDYTAPVLSVITGTPSLTNVNTATFDMTGSTDFSPVTFLLSLDGGITYVSTTSLLYTLSSIGEGTNTVTVKAVDAAGNMSTPYTYSWTTDYTAPTATETNSLVAPVTGVASMTFGVTPSETVTYAAISSTGTSGAFAGPTLNYTPTAEGYQNLQIQITDLAGNATSLTPYQWFYGADLRILGGQFYGTGAMAGSTGSANGELALVSTGGTGNYVLYTAGTYLGSPLTGAWSVYSGGPGTTVAGADGYWISRASGTGETAGITTASTQFKYLSASEYIAGGGTYAGTLSGGLSVNSTEYSFSPTLTSTPLAAGGTVLNQLSAFNYWDTKAPARVDNGFISGSVGSVSDIFATGGQFLSVGEFSNFGNYNIWSGDIYMTNASGSVFSGGMGGIAPVSGASDGMMGGIFINPDGSTGYMFAKAPATTMSFYSPDGAFSNWGMYDFSATVAPVVMGVTAVAPIDLNLNMVYSQGTGLIFGAGFDMGTFMTDRDYLVDQTWGTEYIRMGALLTGSPVSQNWTASASGQVKDFLGTPIGYSLLAINGSSWTGGVLAGTFTDTTLTYDYLSTLVDSAVMGVYDDAAGYWEGFGYGIYTSQPLTASTMAGTGSFETARAMDGIYMYTNSNSTYQYSIDTNYWSISINGYVARTMFCDAGCTSVYEMTYYYPDGTTMTEDLIGMSSTFGTWDPATFNLQDLTIAPVIAGDVAYMSTGNDMANAVWEHYWLSYIVGTPDSLWDTVNPAGLTYLGSVGGALPGEPFRASFIDTWLTPYDQVAATYTTFDGGSYDGYLLVSVVDGVAKGIGVALYVDNGSTGMNLAGYLDMTLSGNYYPDTAMISMTGTSTPTVMFGSPVLPVDLYWMAGGGTFGARLFGGFGTGGDFYADSNNFGGGTGWIAGANWGILGAGLGALLGPVSGPWSGTMAGNGSFGEYNDIYGTMPDDGFYVASANGTTANGFITGTFNGSYITMTSMGMLDGDVLLGMEDYNLAATGGVVGNWQRTDLLSYSAPVTTTQWSKGVFNAYSMDAGTYLYLSGASYSYNIYDAPDVMVVANTVLMRADSSMLTVEYYRDGTKVTCDSATGICAETTWNPATFSLRDLTAPVTLAGDSVTGFIPPEVSGTWSSEYMTMNAILGGVTSLWGATPADMTVMGQMFTNLGMMAPKDFGFITPVESWNPLWLDTTTIDGGAFKGYLGGAAANGIMKGGVMALYMDPAGNVGVLRAGLGGAYYPEMMSFDMTGSTVKYQIGTIGAYGPAALSANVFTSMNGWFGMGAIAGASGWLGGGTNNAGDFETSWILGQDWGIFGARVVGGSYLVNNGSWTADLGGSAVFGSYLADNLGYYSAHVGSGVSSGGVLTGQALGNIMTYLYTGTLDADLYFALNDIGMSYEGSALGMWEAVTPLSHSAEMTMYETKSDFYIGYEAMFGGIDSLWDGVVHNVTSLGTYYGNGYWGSQYPKALYSNGWWSSHPTSYDVLNGTQTANDGGAYRLILAGIDLNGSVSLFGKGLYIDPTGTKVGILTTVNDLTGTVVNTYSSTDGTLELNGAMRAVEIASISPISPDLFYNIYSYSPPTYVVSGIGSFGAGGTITVDNATSYIDSFAVNGVGFGVWGAAINGSYTGLTSPNWALNLVMPDATVRIDGTSWSAGTFAGAARGYWADAPTGVTGIIIGEVKGVADAGMVGFIEAAAAGAHFETNQYLSMLGNGAGQSALSALNVPFAEVGMDTLSGGNGNINMTLANAKFFAYQSGAKPLIWATDSVSGTYATTPTGGNTVSLAGSQTSATFIVNSWGVNVNDGWSGSITNGTGTLSGGTYSGAVNFEGSAGGTITALPAAGPGTIIGTAAGIAY